MSSDPASGVLRNRFGITDPDRLRVVGADLTAAAVADLGTRILPGGYDLVHLRLFHAEIFGDLYPWAGEIRTVGIAKSDPFAEVNAIHPFREGNGRAQRAFFRQLSREAGRPIDWSGLDPQRNADASMASLRGDNSLLQEMLDSLVSR